ncbi:MAG: T9SS type A sorting domain-containing protein, partial [Bacteroidia bacterium]
IIANTSGVLPIELLNFDVTCLNKKCEITWETATERSNDHFEIEKSSDAVDFKMIELIKSKAVNGNSNSKINYSTYDNDPVKGTGYYRLKQVNTDRSYNYSKIVSVSNTISDNVSFVIYPNPNKGEFSVDVSGIENNHDVEIFIYSNEGKIIYNSRTDSDSLKNKQFTFELGPNTANGLYKVVFVMEGVKYTSSLIIQ